MAEEQATALEVDELLHPPGRDKLCFSPQGWTRGWQLWSLQLGCALPGAASSLEHPPLLETCSQV